MDLAPELRPEAPEAPTREHGPLVEVAVALPVDGTFTYALPAGLAPRVGHAVVVPFGSRQITAYVVGHPLTTELPELKTVARLLDPEPVFSEDQLPFFRWIADYYLAGLGEVISTALPGAYKGVSRRVYHPAQAGIDALAAEAADPGSALRAGRAAGPALSQDHGSVLREVVLRPGRTRRALARALHGEIEADRVDRVVESLLRAGLIRAEEEEIRDPGGQVPVLSLAVPADEIPTGGGARMRGVLARLVEAGGSLDLSELVDLEGPGARPAIARLLEKGVLQRSMREDRDPFLDAMLDEPHAEAPTLNEEQEAAFEAICGPEPRTWMLHGVTGSGKTEVYLRAAAAVLERERQVLVLVPEIALTPQLCARFRARFGDQVAVLHSGLAPLARLREWRRIRAGEATIAVGARSALFSPFRQLGLIVVDEEHDDSYKQDDGVRYHARDLAVVLGRQHRCPVVLGSATPSLETWQNAEAGRYGRLRLTRRATPRAVPRIELVDLRGRPPDLALAPELLSALGEAFEAGGKAIVLYNRRGYAPVVECPGCGAHYACPSCGVAMVYHQARRRLTCHYCGFFQPFSESCPLCASPFEVLGHGTERVEEALVAAFPGIGVARMDADATSTRGAHHRILSDFRSGRVRLLVGTQLVAKGHDFPDVHVAAVVGVDHILMLPDFRSGERTFSLVTQLAGRAGRGQTPGRVLVQTRHADHFVFRLLTQGGEIDPDAFYAEEARQRRVLAYPPFTRLVLIRVEGAARDQTLNVARELAGALRREGDPKGHRVDILGPEAAAMPRLVGRWRFQILIRGRDTGQLRAWLQRVRSRLFEPGRSGARVVVDVDPRSLL